MCVARQLKAYLKFRPNIDGQLFLSFKSQKNLIRLKDISEWTVSLKFK